MTLHSDSGYVPPPHPEYLLSANAVWMIDDFTEESGGTRYVPGSHKLRNVPEPRRIYQTVAIIRKAGSVAFLHGYTWHKTAANSRASATRAVRILRAAVPAGAGKSYRLGARGGLASRFPTPAPSARRRFWLNSIGFFDGPPKAYREAAFPRRSGLGTPPKLQSQNK